MKAKNGTRKEKDRSVNIKEQESPMAHSGTTGRCLELVFEKRLFALLL